VYLGDYSGIEMIFGGSKYTLDYVQEFDEAEYGSYTSVFSSSPTASTVGPIPAEGTSFISTISESPTPVTASIGEDISGLPESQRAVASINPFVPASQATSPVVEMQVVGE